MEFENYVKKMKERFEKISGNDLFTVSADNDEMVNNYLDSFPEEINPIFVKRPKNDCSACKSFVKRMGNIVFINENYQLESIWDFDSGDEFMNRVNDSMSKFIKLKNIENIFCVKERKIGHPGSSAIINGELFNFVHLNADIPEKFRSESPEEVMGASRDLKGVFSRGIRELTLDSLETVLEISRQGSLYKGVEWVEALSRFIIIKKEFENIQDERKDNFLWKKFSQNRDIARLRNNSIGVLLIDLSEGMDLEAAVKKYEKNIVAPESFCVSRALATPRMIDEAKKKIYELGYDKSLKRRFAEVKDISINDLIFANRNVKAEKTLDIFEEIKMDSKRDVPKFKDVQEIGINDFISNVIPTADSIELLFTNELKNNLVSMITSEEEDSKSMFKWGNNMSWAYYGNITDSSMKENVKKMGGKVVGDLRMSIEWNQSNDNNSDLDLHCFEANNNHIYFSNKGSKHPSSGMLDVDIRFPKGVAVENIIYSDKSKMPHGIYTMSVKNFSKGSKNLSGFKAEIEFDGNIFEFERKNSLADGEMVVVAKVKWDGEKFELIEEMKSSSSVDSQWGIIPNEFAEIKAICHSPNYWNDKECGNHHIFFMLKGANNPDKPSGFFNEYLNSELFEHRKAMQMIANKLRVEGNEDQLSGVGFSLTQRKSFVVKVKNKTQRIFKIII